MADSLRTRLVVWLAGMVMLVIAMVGAAVCWATWQSRLSAVDAELLGRAQAVAGAVRRSGSAFDVELPAEALAYFQRRDLRPYYAVWSGTRELVDRSDPDRGPAAAPRPGASTHGAYRELAIERNGLMIVVARDISEVWRELWLLAATVIVVAVIGIVAALAVAWSLAGRALAPVQRINATAQRMAEGDLTARIAVDRTETELGQVAFALNLAFDRQRESVERQRRFTADASHQLRTPVATMLAEVDFALMRDRDAAAYRESLETCRRAAARMRALVEGLLMLARAESGELPLRRSNVRLDRIVADALDLLRPLAASREVALELAAEPVGIFADPARIHEVVSNLVFNAIVYNHPEGVVTVQVDGESGQAVLRVRDSGIGIDADDLPKIFDRFHRSDAARAREPAGAGLGLALANWIVGAHGGSITASSEPGRFTELVVRLPGPGQAVAATGAGRRSATFASPPIAPSASTNALTPPVQIEPMPQAASSE